TPAIRSSQTSEQVSGTAAQAGGVPGALSNQPPAPATAPINGSPSQKSSPLKAEEKTNLNSNKSATVNYEVDRTIRHVRQSSGTLKRVSAAVVVNYRKGADKKAGPKPLGEEEMTQINALVKEAIGFSKERGDSINVANRPFTEPEAPEPVKTPLW